MKSGAFWGGILAGVILAGLVGLFVLPIIGVFDMTATGNKNVLDYWGEANLESTISKRAPQTTLPDTANPAEGFAHYMAVCLHCHGGPDAEREAWAHYMLPKPPELWQGETQTMSDGELFYVINNGIRMTGMPAFGPDHPEKDIWNMVAIVRQLDTLSKPQQEQLQRAASLYQHGGEHDGHEHK